MSQKWIDRNQTWRSNITKTQRTVGELRCLWWTGFAVLLRLIISASSSSWSVLDDVTRSSNEMDRYITHKHTNTRTHAREPTAFLTMTLGPLKRCEWFTILSDEEAFLNRTVDRRNQVTKTAWVVIRWLIPTQYLLYCETGRWKLLPRLVTYGSH